MVEKFDKFIITFFVVIVLPSFNASTNETENVICSDLKNIPFFGSFLVSHTNVNHKRIETEYYLSTSYERKLVKINLHDDWTELEKSWFDPTAKTFILIHGYRSGGKKPWVLELKERLLSTRQANVIIVDWNNASHTKNYITAAKKTEFISNKIFNFLQKLRPNIEKLINTSINIKWNRLHFIGHSLGAHISGQTAHILKQDPFWKVERITGLDPAKPCFVGVKPNLRIDKDNANFVDIIHTQVGTGISGFGIKENIGHTDFYVNGGVAQPQCLGSVLTPKWKTVICSHKSSVKYFIDSIVDLQNDTCLFEGYEWDKTYNDALRILNEKMGGQPCENCPKMGINANVSKKRGNFLVITSLHEPYCRFDKNDYKKLSSILKRIKY